MFELSGESRYVDLHLSFIKNDFDEFLDNKVSFLFKKTGQKYYYLTIMVIKM